jgi:tetratricopeptide (TPR) repeat protein
MQPTKLGRYSENVIEAVWLVALIVVPLFFNVYSSRIFEPDKITLVRSLAVIGLGAWVIKLVDERGISFKIIDPDSGVPWWKQILKTPLVPQVIGLVLIYALSTAFSVAPTISFFGSYQRLQGAYSTFSYIIIFGLLAGHLRSRAQIDRLITVAILTSLPVGLYGVLQRFEIDPIPWGGNTSQRVASSMGNAIFVAAFLIMVVPLTIGRIVETFTAILNDEEENVANQIIRGSIYVFIAAIQLIAIYYTFSRGPLLGLLAGLFFLFLLLSLYWDKRWVTISTVAIAGFVGIFLLVMSIPDGPLASLRSRGGFGRLATVFEVDSGTGLVRKLIWEGASDLVWFHEPLVYPDGEADRWNFARPFIGYGPESMYVAYNPFFPTQLADIEARNAAPDRSHNETWDSLVISGGVGLLAYLALFTSIFYYGLKWLRMIPERKHTRLFWGLLLGGGVLTTGLLIYFMGIEFFGVGLPLGILLGLLLYITIVALSVDYVPPETSGEKHRSLLLMIFLAAIIAHFVEIHFGIAIGSSRTYFWAYTAVLLVVGHILPDPKVYALDLSVTEKNRAKSSRRKKVEKSENRTSLVWIISLLVALILATLSFNFFSNPDGSTSLINIIFKSITVLPRQEKLISYGVLSIFVTSWVIGTLLFASDEEIKSRKWLGFFGGVLLLSLFLWFLYGLFHAGSLASLLKIEALNIDQSVSAQVAIFEGLLSKYYFMLLLVILALGFVLNRNWPKQAIGYSGLSLVTIPVTLVLVYLGVVSLNMRVIQADIIFKVSSGLINGSNPETYQSGLKLLDQASEYAPAVDHYYLFMGRGNLELARLMRNSSVQESERLMDAALEDLKSAQETNQLNTDHTANLARLYRMWHDMTNDPERKQEFIDSSFDYYQTALTLSPRNAVIWNEYASLTMVQLKDPEKALEIVQQSIDVDPYYASSYALLGDFYIALSQQRPDEKEELLSLAIDAYQTAFEQTNYEDNLERAQFLEVIGRMYVELGDYEAAIEFHEKSLGFVRPGEIWRIELILAELYVQTDDFPNALYFATEALAAAPQDQSLRIEDLIRYIQQNSQ